MIRVSRMADYGVVVMSHIALHADRPHTASEIAAYSRLPQPTVSKLLKQLAHCDLLRSQRGAKGGYRLNRKPEEITVGELILALDGPIVLCDCLEGHEGVCDIESFCPVRGPWGRVSAAIREALESVTLAEMIAPVPDFISGFETTPQAPREGYEGTGPTVGSAGS